MHSRKFDRTRRGWDRLTYMMTRRLYQRLFLVYLFSVAPLLPPPSSEPTKLTLWLRGAESLMNAFQSWLDVWFRRRFDRIEHLVPPAEAPSSAGGPRDGILLMASTLGAGGAERQLVATAKAISGSEKVGVACGFLDRPGTRFFLSDLEAAGIPATVIGSEGDSAMPADARAFIQALPVELREVSRYAATLFARRPKIVHLWLDEVNIKGGIAAVLSSVPCIVLSQRSLPPTHFVFYQPYMREAYRWLARQPNVAMVNNSAAGARAYEKWLGLAEGTISVVRNACMLTESDIAEHRAARGTFRRQLGIPPEAPIVGAVMRLGEEKRPHLWLEIAAAVRKAMPQTHFLIAGDGPLRKTLQRRAARSDLAGSVHFIGAVKDVLDAMVDMDLLLLTSRAEGLPNVLIEAQFLGVPVVATPVGGVPEVVDHGRSGWLLAGDDASGSAGDIVRLLRDAAWREQAARVGPAVAKERFGMPRLMNETLALYWKCPRTEKGGLMSRVEEQRFEFGQNWHDFVQKNYDEERVAISKRHILKFMGRDDLAGLSILDIGCGSGLHSVAMLTAEAACLHGFDYDPESIKATRFIRGRARNAANWTVEQGSVLDEAYLDKLPLYDLVYSWGVLHHTGDVWRAMRNAAGRVKPGGLLYVALYSADVQRDPEFWLDVKRRYIRAGWLGRRVMEAWYVLRFEVGRDPRRLVRFLRSLREYKKNRGMSKFTDIRDWLGGWPMEFVYDKDAVSFVEKLGFKLDKIATGEANTEFLFVRDVAS